ncbi:MAG: metalloenzyme [Leptospiraceae bacterium]|nr:metalloenzyme [Leptospiraceae bacterium]
MSFYYLFIDGIGLGGKEDHNPFHVHAKHLFRHLAGEEPGDSVSSQFLCVPADAHMGFSGLPQSATGQTSLWTGMNGPASMGRHMTGFPGPTLIRVIEQYSMIKLLSENGKKAALLNGYSKAYLDRIERKPRLRSASTHVHRASGQPLFLLEDVLEGRALYMDITHQFLHHFYPDFAGKLPIADPRERGRQYVKIGREYDLVLFEYFLTDKAGHNQSMEEASMTIQILEPFIEGILEEMDPLEDTLVISSDHGNMEDLSTKTHTNNLVPVFLSGKYASDMAGQIKYLYDIPRAIFNCMDFDSGLPDPLAMAAQPESA